MFGLDAAPEVLIWGAECDRARAPVEAAYHGLLDRTFDLVKASEESQGALNTLMEGLEPAMLRRVVRAPRSARRLLWYEYEDPRQVIMYFKHALAAERVVEGVDDPDGFSGWTADGRAHIAGGRIEWQQPAAESRDIVLDLGSEHARTIGLIGGSGPSPLREVPNRDVATATLKRIGRALAALPTDGPVSGCVDAWVRVIVAQSEPGGRFWSGTNGPYVGRVMLVNAQREQVSFEELVDAIVHEAIHGFLYMHESVERWVTDQSLYTDKGAVISPWSGQLLPVRPFMQACFVWYGLTMFWGAQLESVFMPESVRYLLNRAISGFRTESLVDLLAPFKSQVKSEMFDVIDRMQRTVHDLLR